MDSSTLPHPPLELLNLVTAYQRSKTLFTLTELRIPTLLSEQEVGTLALEKLAKLLNLHPLAADRFLNACVALGLLERDTESGQKYRNSRLSEEFLVDGKTTYLGNQFLNYDRTSYALWADLTTKLRDWRPAETDQQVPQDDDQGSESMSAQHNLARLVGHALAESYDFSQHQHMLDLGGGTAAMSISVCSVHAHLQSTMFDLPAIASEARVFVERAKLEQQIKIVEGNFKEDELPSNFDVALLANLMSVASEETNRQLLRRIYGTLPDDGAIILSGWILDDSRTSPIIPVLFCLEDIGWQTADVERTHARYQKWLEEAGFVEIEHRHYCPPTSMIIGRKRASNLT